MAAAVFWTDHRHWLSARYREHLPTNSSSLPFPFLLLEARFGKSRLQNYDAIVTGRFVGSYIGIPWRLTLCWARALVMLGGTNTTYVPEDEVSIISRRILRAEGALYFVLAVQPISTALGFMIAVWLYKMPIGRNFGIVALLGGLDKSDLAIFQGAGLSGRLEKPVELDITIRQMPSEYNEFVRHGQGGKIGYLAKPESDQHAEGVEKGRNHSRLEKGCKYE